MGLYGCVFVIKYEAGVSSASSTFECPCENHLTSLGWNFLICRQEQEKWSPLNVI
jgi:hypothetical protein